MGIDRDDDSRVRENVLKLRNQKVETFFHGTMGLHLGTFYGMLFEPYFRERYVAQS